MSCRCCNFYFVAIFFISLDVKQCARALTTVSQSLFESGTTNFFHTFFFAISITKKELNVSNLFIKDKLCMTEIFNAIFLKFHYHLKRKEKKKPRTNKNKYDLNSLQAEQKVT